MLGLRFGSLVRNGLQITAALVLVVGLVPAALGQNAPVDHSLILSDVTGGVHKPAIDKLNRMGLFEGTLCFGERRFCPDRPIQRWVMAVWLVRALDAQVLQPEVTDLFEDVAHNQWWAPHVDVLAELGVTLGCATEPARFCPQQSVTRAQMASFLVRAFDLPPSSDQRFVDTDGNYHHHNINALASAEVTKGCQTEPARYCPDREVTRAEMATFLARSLDMLPESFFPTYPASPEPISSVLRIAYTVTTKDAVIEYVSETDPYGGEITYPAVVEESEIELRVEEVDGSNRWSVPLEQLIESAADAYDLTASRGWFEWSPGGTRIAYLAPGNELWVADADGSNRLRIAEEVYLHPWWRTLDHWSPDGARLAYQAAGGRRAQLRVVNADGTGDRGVDYIYGYPLYRNRWDWSPDSKQLLYKGYDGAHVLWLLDLESSKKHKVTRGVESWGSCYLQDEYSCWSSNSTHFLADFGGQLSIYNRDGSLVRIATRDEGTSIWWSGDGSHVMLIPQSDDGQRQIRIENVDGTHQQMITVNAPYSFWSRGDFSWSPSGAVMTYKDDTGLPSYNRGAEGNELWIESTDGSTRRMLTSRYAGNRQWWETPERTRLLYDQSTDSGRIELWMETIDGTKRQLLASGGPGFNVGMQLGTDGRYLLLTDCVALSSYGDQLIRTGNNHLALIDIDGSHSRILSYNLGHSGRMSSDSSHVAYTTYPLLEDDSDDQFVASNRHLQIEASDGTGQRYLGGKVMNFEWSAVG